MGFFQHLCCRIVIIACLLTGCSVLQPEQPNGVPHADVELINTPFFPQQQYQCGPAALAMVLQTSGVVVRPKDLAPRLYLPGKKGSLQLEIIAAIRHYQRIPYIIKPELEAIAAELQAGRPVLVLQNLGLKVLPAYHYAVVVGMQSSGRIVLRSGTTKRLVMDLDDFLITWKKTGSWAIIVLNPDQLPTDLDLVKYLEILAEIEATGNVVLAQEGYRTLLKHYPDQPTALFGLANTLFVRKKFFAAAELYRSLLNHEPSHAAAANNLAESLANLHCFSEALKLLDTFLLQPGRQSNLSAILSATRKEIAESMQAKGERDNDCRQLWILPDTSPFNK